MSGFDLLLGDKVTDTHVIEKGPQDGPPVVLVHGAWHGAWAWRDNYMDLFADAGFRVISPDLRGHGELATGHSMLKHRLKHYVDDIEAVIDGFAHPPIVIGHSMGGYICQHLMARGVAMRGVGLLASVPSYGAIGAVIWAIRHRTWRFVQSNLKLSLYPLVEDPDEAVELFLDDDVTTEVGHAFAAQLGDEGFLAFLDMLFLALPSRPARPYPVCVIGGARDAIFSVASQKALAKRLKAQACHILDSPHNVMMSTVWRKSGLHYIDWMKSLSA